MTKAFLPDPTSMERALVLGATGFIGSHVLDRLRAIDGVRVMALAHRRVDFRGLEDVDLVMGSLTRLDLGWLERFRPDTIIHLARLAGRGSMRRSLAARRGRAANRRLIDWLVRHAPGTHVVYVSGSLVYGDRGEAPCDEATELRPIAYAREYVRAEEPWMECRVSGALPVTIVRPPWVVGPGSWFHTHYALPALRDGATPLYGDGGNWMTFLDVRDCAGAIVHLAARRSPGRVYNLFAPGQVARQIDFVEVLAARTATPVERVEAGRGRLRDRAVREALTSSFVASTMHDDFAHFRIGTPAWQTMIDDHLPAA